MQAFGQAGAAPAAWARIQLVRGQSNGAVWQIDSQYPQARLSIGSDPGAGWPIHAFGVQPNHFEIYWDGRSLFLADTLRVGGVMLNGAPVGQEWVQIRERGEVVFGQAAMTIETSDAAVRPIQTDPSIARRVSVEPGTSEIQPEATRVAEPSWTDAHPLEGESTRIGDETMMPSLGVPQLGGPQLGGPQLGGGAGRPPPPPPGGARPRLGGNPGGGGVREQAPTLMGGMDGPIMSAPEATRMVALDDVPPSVVVAPSFGAPQQGAFGAPQQGAFGAPPQGGFGAPGAAFAPGAPGGAFAPTAPPSPPVGGFAMPTGPGGFAAPPAPTTGRSGGRNLPKIPPRTLIMIGGLLVAVLVALLMLMPGEPELPPPGPLAPPYVPGALTAPVAPTTPAVAPPAVAPPAVAPPTTPVVAPTVAPPTTPAVAPVAPATTPSVAPVAVAPTTPAVAPTVATTPTVAPPTTPTVAPTTPVVVAPTPIAPVAATLGPGVDPSTLPPTEDRRAADLAIAGRFAEALPIYQGLAAAHPERPEYGMMVHLLERRITDANCTNGLTPDGRPCATGGR